MTIEVERRSRVRAYRAAHNALNKLNEEIPSQEQTNEQFIRLGVRREAFENGECHLPFFLLGNLTGVLLRYSAGLREVTQWLRDGVWPQEMSCPEDPHRLAQLERFRRVALEELAHLGGDPVQVLSLFMETAGGEILEAFRG